MIVDVIVDLQYGDCGKGKVTHSLLKSGEYTHCIRYNGGNNAGHTIYHEGKKIVTHIIPAGVMYGIKSIIGPGCVVDVESLKKEIQELEEAGIKNVKQNLFVDKRTHLIRKDHIEKDGDGGGVGSTKRGIGPAYTDKYARKGIRAEAFIERDIPFPVGIIDIYEELHNNPKTPVVLMEGAQGFGLDIDWGDYPYVTSSHCTTAGAMLCGIPPRFIRRVYGVCKAYETYVGTKSFQDNNNPIFDQIQKLGQEFGATTGRVRQCNYLDIDLLERAVRINGVTDLVVNKMDILKELNHFRFRRKDGSIVKCHDEHDFKLSLVSSLSYYLGGTDNIKFSYSPEDI